MLRTKCDRAASPREGAGCGVEVGLSFPFLAAPPTALLRGGASLDETLRDGVSRDSNAAFVEAFHRHLPGAVPSRVYVGNETCERLLPTPKAIGSWAAAARGARVALSLVLPPLSRDGLAKAEGVVRALQGVEDSEVVAGDWGTVHRLRSRYPGLTLVLGRLTHKMLRDPRLADRFDSPLAPLPARSALCRSGELAPGFRALMERYGIGRREIDPFLQPLEGDEWEGRGERLSVHLPYQFVTMGRGCLPAAMHVRRKGRFVAGGPCRTECAKYAVEFRVPVPGGNGAGRLLLSLGNALYHAVPPHVVERALARLSSRERVDRVVVAVPAAERRPS
ncbi:MAG: hypothetical protein WAV26_02355 [Candidatus Deferrimicrobium sp.]